MCIWEGVWESGKWSVRGDERARVWGPHGDMSILASLVAEFVKAVHSVHKGDVVR